MSFGAFTAVVGCDEDTAEAVASLLLAVGLLSTGTPSLIGTNAFSLVLRGVTGVSGLGKEEEVLWEVNKPASDNPQEDLQCGFACRVKYIQSEALHHTGGWDMQ
jgi:hypothetical protein